MVAENYKLELQCLLFLQPLSWHCGECAILLATTV